MSAENAGVPVHDATSAAWPRWTAITLVMAGIVVIVAETTSYLVFAGVLLTAIGAYELAVASRSRPPAVRPSAME
jgi:hypothetical protein